MRPAAARARLRRQHLPQQHAERVAVGGGAEHAARQNLRRLVGERAAHCLDGDAGKHRSLRAPKVRHLRAEAAVSAWLRDRARAPLALGMRSRQRVTRQGSQGFKDAVRCWQAASAHARCLDAGRLRLLPPRSALSARLRIPQGASRHKACMLSSATCRPSIPHVTCAPGKRCEGRGVHRLHAAASDTQTLDQPSRRGTAKHCVQGPALCRGRALARRRPTPSTPHAPWAPLLVRSTLLDARSPCTCPAATASAPRATPLCVLSCAGFMQPGQRELQCRKYGYLTCL